MSEQQLRRPDAVPLALTAPWVLLIDRMVEHEAHPFLEQITVEVNRRVGPTDGSRHEHCRDYLGLHDPKGKALSPDCARSIRALVGTVVRRPHAGLAPTGDALS